MIYQQGGVKMTLPLYRKIYQDLERAIQSGSFSSGSQLPTEKELADTYQVSRITSKRALNELETSGYIYRVRGKGSFVKDNLPSPVHQTNRILFLLPFMKDLSLGNFTEGLSPIMQANNLDVLMTTMAYLNHKNAEEIIQEFDGLIYYVQYPESHLDLFAALAFKKFPVILLDKKIYDLPFPTIMSENTGGGFSATNYLIQDGHHRIAYLFGQESLPQSVRQRYLGYIQAIKEAGLDFLTTIEDKKNIQTHLIDYVKENSITALVCENDLTAIHAMKFLKEAGFLIPEDISIVGFDNIQAASLVEPPLTTVAQDFKRLGQIAGQYLVDSMRDNQLLDDKKIPVALIKRQSTKELK